MPHDALVTDEPLEGGSQRGACQPGIAECMVVGRVPELHGFEAKAGIVDQFGRPGPQSDDFFVRITGIRIPHQAGIDAQLAEQRIGILAVGFDRVPENVYRGSKRGRWLL